MDLYREELKEGSVLICGEQGDYGSGDLQLSLVLVNRGDGVCEVRGTIGRLSNEININIGMIAISYGYHTMHTKAQRGKTVSRWLTKTHSDSLFDYYTVDLLQKAIDLGIEGAL